MTAQLHDNQPGYVIDANDDYITCCCGLVIVLRARKGETWCFRCRRSVA